ncbi:hypothetical protein MMC10_008053 [Thelotrema lepadinum]|nr:hypothetical protein [Thelotrema lepadinum]
MLLKTNRKGNPDYPSKPERFFRVTDETSTIRYLPGNTPAIKGTDGLNAAFLASDIHPNGRPNPAAERSLITIYSTFERAAQEAYKRHQSGRKDLTLFMISSDSLKWDTINFDETRDQTILADDSFVAKDGTPLPVMFLSAKDVIDGDPTHGFERDENVELGVEDVWFAMQWIPEDMISSKHKGMV